MFVWLIMMMIAHAAILQSAPLDTKDEAKKLLSISKRLLKKEKGIKLRHGKFLVPKVGYRYRVIIEGRFGEDRAKSLAKKVYSSWTNVELLTEDKVLKKYNADGHDFERPKSTERIAQKTEEDKPTGTEPPETEIEDQKASELEVEKGKEGIVKPKIDDILLFAVESMSKISAKWGKEDSEKFEFIRKLHHGGKYMETKHLFLRSGDSMRLEVTILEGEGENSTTVLTPSGKGILKVNDKSAERSSIRTKETLKTFSSEWLLSVLLNFENDVQTDGPWRQLDAFEKLEGAWRLYHSSGGDTQRIQQAIISEKEGWLIQLVLNDEKGALEYRWTEYTDLGEGTFVPFKMERIRNGTVEEVIIIEHLFLGIEIPKEKFEAP